MTKLRSTIRLENGKFFGLFFKKDHRKKFRVENRKFFWSISKKAGHLEFGVPGNVIYKKSPDQTICSLSHLSLLFCAKACKKLRQVVSISALFVISVTEFYMSSLFPQCCFQSFKYWRFGMA